MNPFKHILSTSLICAMLVTGCGAEGAKGQAQTPEDAIQTALTALRELDMETFNACTNNRKGDKYLLFGDLLNPLHACRNDSRRTRWSPGIRPHPARH